MRSSNKNDPASIKFLMRQGSRGEIKNWSIYIPSIKEAYILCLSRFQDTFELVAKNAFESASASSAIKEFVR